MFPPSDLTVAPVDAVHRDRLWKHLLRFSQSVRSSGSPAEAEAFAYAENVLANKGYRTNLIRHPAYISLPVSGRLRVDGHDITCITHAMASHQPDGIRAPIKRADGANSSASIRGCIALLDGLASPGAVKRVQERGAVAAIFINAELTYEMIVSPVWGNPAPSTAENLPEIPVVSVQRKHADQLEQAAASSINVEVITEVDTGWRDIPLLEATLESPLSNGDFVMFSGHIDAWHLGAMDNGSANATMLEVATVMADNRDAMQRDLRLLFWSGHSHGRYAGSAWYADNNFELLHDHCVLHVNIDSVGGQGASVLTEAPCMPEAFGLAAGAIRDETGINYVGTRFERAGDQSFWGTGVPSVFMGLSEQRRGDDVASQAFAELFGGGRAGGFGWWWHTPEDTIDKLDQENLERDCRIYLRLVYRACTAPILPLSFKRTVEEIRQHLLNYADTAREAVDLSKAIDRANDLITVIGAFEDSIGKAIDPHQSNQTMKKLSRVLVPLNYVAGSRFEHDPALSQPPIPSLASILLLAEVDDIAERQQLLVALRRALNRVELKLREAISIVETELERIDE